MLALENVSVGYGSGDVVKNISINVTSNENLSIIGPNGCGKTTLLKAIAGLLPFKGDISIGGKSIRKMKQKEISLKVAMLTQSAGVYFSYSVYDTVMMGRYPHIKDRLMGLPSAQDKNYVAQCLAAVDLLNERNRDITKLSGGQLQRVFLARTLAQNPDIILLDEPTNHLDLKYQLELVEYLKTWSAQGDRSVIGVMHDINLAMGLSDNVMVIKDGETRAFGKTRQVLTVGLLEDVYGIDVAGYMRSALKMWEGMRE